MSLNEAITLGNLNQSVQCAPGAVLTFTGATNGFVISGNLHHSMQINNCTLATTNPRAGKAILLQANTTGVNLNNIIFRNSGSGAWTHGVYTTSVNIINNWTNLYCAGIAHCVYLQDQANATNIFNLAIDGTYNTGVEVEARPPGKRIKRLSLLSGGERSLVAVAFLVALFKARPSPFYILDEVEAALDDTNLGRLLEIYEELRENSQLIVITHQKRTMEVGDALYGVSMRGDGISAVISQRLREAESA